MGNCIEGFRNIQEGHIKSLLFFGGVLKCCVQLKDVIKGGCSFFKTLLTIVQIDSTSESVEDNDTVEPKNNRGYGNRPPVINVGKIFIWFRNKNCPTTSISFRDGFEEEPRIEYQGKSFRIN